MSVSRAFVRSWLPVIVAFIIGASMVGVSWAATTVFGGTVKARNFLYKSPKKAQLAIGAAAFVPNQTTCNFLFEGGHHFHDLGTDCTYSAQVELPQGAKITKVQWNLANGIGSELVLNAWTPGLLPSGTELASITSDCSGACVRSDTSIVLATGANPVNDAKSYYSLDIATQDGGSIITVNRVIITYTTNRVGPASA